MKNLFCLFFVVWGINIYAQTNFDWTGTAVTGANYSPNPVANIIDGDSLVSGWGSIDNSPPHDVDFELPAVTTLVGFGFFFSTSQIAGGWTSEVYTPTVFTFSGSMDKINFTTLLTVADSSIKANVWNDYLFDNNVSYKYYKLIITGAKASGWAGITEVRALEDKFPAGTNTSFFVADGATDIRYSKGKVLIGSEGTKKSGDYQLYVQNGILTEKVVIAVKNTNQWADDVFKENYPLQSIKTIEDFIKKNNHLPNVPSAQEIVDEGIHIGDMNAILLRQIEELWLHLIKMEKQINILKKENESLTE